MEGSGHILALLAAAVDNWRIWRWRRQRRVATMRYSPMDSRSPVDHSCVGRNLTVSCRQMRQGRALPFEIPAFAGMSCGGMEGSVHILALLAAAMDNWRIYRWRRQRQCGIRRWISVPPWTIPAKAGISQCRVAKCGGGRALPFEIPAFAGMVCGGLWFAAIFGDDGGDNFGDGSDTIFLCVYLFFGRHSC